MNFALIFAIIACVLDIVIAGNLIKTAKLEEPCNIVIHCSVANSICHKEFSTCRKGKCICANGYLADGNTACKLKLPYNAPCDMTKEVCDPSTSTICWGIPSKCACSRSSETYNTIVKKCLPQYLVNIGAECQSVANCYAGSSGRSAECVGTPKVCACKVNYVEENGVCRKPQYGEACDKEIGCSTTGTPESIPETCLSTGKCGCPSSSSYTLQKIMGEVVGFCQATYNGSKKANGDTCTANNLCSSGICSTCPDEKVRKCLASQPIINIDEPCSHNADCLVANSVCKKDFDTCPKGKCLCAEKYLAERTSADDEAKECKLIMPYNAPCDTTKEACDPSTLTSCDGSPAQCTCLSGKSFSINLKMCISDQKVILGAKCESNNDCFDACTFDSGCSDKRDDPHVECVGTPKVCTCKANYIQENNGCRKPRYGEACTKETGCWTAKHNETVAETCLSSGKCGCPCFTSYTSIKVGEKVYTFCRAEYNGNKKANGEPCTLHRSCNSGMCHTCPGNRDRQCLASNELTSIPSTESCDGATSITINIMYLVAIFTAVLFL